MSVNILVRVANQMDTPSTRGRARKERPFNDSEANLAWLARTAQAEFDARAKRTSFDADVKTHGLAEAMRLHGITEDGS